MDLAVPRSIVKLQYAAARLPLTLLEDHVVARYCGQDALVRVGFERWLGSLDLLAGAELDWNEALIGAHFAVRNPQAVSGCGCGASFAVA